MENFFRILTNLKTRTFFFLSIAIILFFVLIFSALAYTWVEDFLTNAVYPESVGLYVESSTVQHVSYNDASADCYYVKQTNGVWSTPVKYASDLVGGDTCSRSYNTSIVLDGSIPVISFVGTTNQDIWMARRDTSLANAGDDASWSYETFYNPGTNTIPSMAIDSSGKMGITFSSNDSGLKLIYGEESVSGSGCTMSNWFCETVTSDAWGSQDLVFNNSNIPVVAFSTLTKLKVAIRNGGGTGNCTDTDWNCYTIDDATRAFSSEPIGISVNSNNEIGIAYIQSDQLMFAYQSSGATTPSNGCDIDGWQCVTVDSSTNYGYPTDITYFGTIPLIIAQDDTTDEIEFFYYEGSWQNNTIGNFGFNEYMAIDNYGSYVGIAYYSEEGPYPYTILAYDDTTIPTNTAPTVSTTPAYSSQSTDGTGYVTLTVGINDTDANNIKLRVDYSENGTDWYQAYIVSATPSYGSTPNTNNTYSGGTYQIGDTTGISTSSGANTVTFVWNTKASTGGFRAVSGRQTSVQIKITPNDSTVDGTASTSTAFTVDNDSPASGTVSIAAGASYSASASADLTLYAIGASYMKFSNDGVTYSDYEAYATTKSAWDITNATYGGTSTDGTKTVYVMYKDAYGNEATAVSDNIVYDTSSPTNPTSAIDSEGSVSDTWQNNKYDPNFTSFTGESDTNGIQGFNVYFGTDSAGVSTDWTTTDTYDPASFTESGTRYLRVIAKDNAGRWADPDGTGTTCSNSDLERSSDSDCYATIFIHKYDISSPNTPSPAVTPTTWTNTNSFIFTWTNPGDVGGSGVYDYTYQTDAGTSATNTTDLSVTLTSNADGTKLFQVRANDEVGNPGSNGSVNFYYDVTPPTNAGTVTDNSGSFDNTYGSVSDPDFTWTTGSDSSSGVKEYDIYWGTDTGGTTVTTTSTTNAYNPSALTEANVPYYLRIKTRDNALNESGWETKYTFKYSQIPDNPTSLAQTANSASLSMGSWTNDTTPTLSFILSDPDIDTLGYELYVDDNSDFSSPIVDYLYGANDIVSGTTKSFTIGQALESGATYTVGSEGQTLTENSYYWKVKAIESHSLTSSDVTANSGGIAFKIDSTAPDISSISFVSSSTSSSSITVSASGITDALSGLASAPYYFENTSSGTNSGWQSGNSWTSSSLNAGTSYNFKVTILDAAGNTRESNVISVQTEVAGGAPLSLNYSSSSNTDNTSNKEPEIEEPEIEEPEPEKEPEKKEIEPEPEPEQKPEETPEQKPNEEELKEQQKALEEATDTVIETFTSALEEEQKIQEVQLDKEEVEQAIEKYEEEQKEEEKNEEEIQEEQKLEKEKQKSLEKVIKGEATEEEKKSAQEYANKKTNDSLANALKKQESVKVSIVDEKGNKGEKEIKDLKNVKVITNTGKTEKEIKEEYDKAKKEKKELIVLDGEKVNEETGTSVDFALTHGLDPFDKEALDQYVWGENKESKVGGEVSIGDPPEYMPTDEKLTKVVMDSKAGAGKSIKKVTGTPGKKVHGTAMAKNKKVANAKNKIMQTNVLFSDMVADLDTTGEEIYIGSTTLDENGHGVIMPEESIPDGEYYFIVGDENGIEDISTLVVNNEKAPEAPELEIIETKQGLLPTIARLLTFIEKITDFNAQEFIAESKGNIAMGDKIILKGKASPGSTVYIMYQSRILNSALIADASQGEFELEIPSELADGDHEILAYIYDENNSMLGNITTLLFNK